MSDSANSRTRTDARLSRLALAGHVALLLVSGIAFATFLAPPAPAWLQTPANQKVAAFMFAFGGQTTVVLGALAGILHAASRLGWRTALASSSSPSRSRSHPS